jgi:glycosyltransferase involved in cell wall biosynthesis
MKLKVLHVINSLRAGGAETLLANSLSPGGLCEHADNSLVYFTGDSWLSGILDPRVTVKCLNLTGGLDVIRAIRQLRRFIIENRFDIVHSHLNPASFYTHLVCPPGQPQVHTVHTAYSMDFETKRSLLLLEKLLYFKTGNCNVICLTDFAREDFVKAISFKGSAFVLNDFVADKFFAAHPKRYGRDRSDLRLVTTGRLAAPKNFSYLLEVLGHCKDQNVSLDIYGAGDKSQFETAIAREHLKIRMMGEYSNIHEVLRDYDLFIMPTKFEGFCISVYEAMASGLPVMVSNIAPFTSVLNDNAIYFDLNNAAGTAGTIKAIVRKEIDINPLAERGRCFAEQTVRRETYVARLLDIYGQLTRKARS